MQPRTVAYPVFLIVELFRLCAVLFLSALASDNSLFWYAALPLLAAVPALWFMLAMDEAKFSHWLPLLAFIKALSVTSFMALSLRVLPEAITFGTSGANNPASVLPIALLFILADAVLGVYAYGRYRVICK